MRARRQDQDIRREAIHQRFQVAQRDFGVELNQRIQSGESGGVGVGGSLRRFDYSE
jgi:hypothetical protein